MKAKFAYLRFSVAASFWFVPGLMLVGAVALSFATLYLDGVVLAGRGALLPMGAEAIRLVLSTIAGSMITVTSLVFTMTLVTLTMASQQLGPRLLRTFMQDSVNQVVLGTFSGTFVYSLLILSTVYGNGGETFLPVISVAVAVVLSIASVAFLIYFIHHLATSIQADTVIANVARQLDEIITSLFPESGDESGQARKRAEIQLPDNFERAAWKVCVAESGYIETIDYDGLLELASTHDLILRLDERPGKFVMGADPVALAWPADRVTEDIAEQIHSAIVMGRARTPAQDVEFAEKALVEVALRALSPGINDEFTAITCVDRLGGSLARAMTRATPQAVWIDKSGQPRVIADPVTFEGLLDGGFHQIRQAAREHVAVVIRLIEVLIGLSGFIRDEVHYRAIRKHRDAIARASAATVSEPIDQADIAERLEVLDAALKRWKGDVGADVERGEP